MKRILFTLLVLFRLISPGFGQSTTSDHAARLQSLLERTSPHQPVSVQVLENESALRIDQVVFPLAETTQMRLEKQQGKYAVSFFLQKGTAVTRTDDPTFRRAYWTLDFPLKQACQEFMALFDQLRRDVKKS